MLAGGGGIALLMFILACLAVIGLVLHKAWAKAPPLWLISLALFFAWCWLAQFWSPYEKVSGFSNAEKIGVMGMMFPAVIWLWAKMRDHRLGDMLRKAVIASFIIGLALMVYELASGFKLSFIYDSPDEGVDPFWRKLDGIRNVGKGIVFASALLLPITALVWEKPFAKFGMVLSAVVITVLAIKLDVSIAIVVPWIGLLVGLFAMRFPNATVKFVFLMAILAIFMSPAFASLISLIDEDKIAALPTSWEHRLYMWHFVFEQIMQSPLIGHGFDSSRSYTETVVLNNGKTMAAVSLHTHNAGLQIWLETGFIGIFLACMTILLLFKPAEAFVAQSKIHAFGFCGFLIAMVLISSVSFGVWEFWWWGTLSFGLACLKLVQIKAKRF